MISVWDYCHIDPVVVEELDFLQDEWNGVPRSESENKDHNNDASSNNPPSSSSVLHSKEAMDNRIQSLLFDTNESCQTALEVLDSVLLIVQDVKNAYFDVTVRTNSLIQKCEDLLDQQHTLQNTVEILQQTLQPFDEIEEVALQLGIPYDAPTNSIGNIGSQKASSNSYDNGSTLTLDPRSPEFQDILNKLSRAVNFLRNHTEIMESERYIQWLDKLQIRATSLIGRAMRDLVEKAAKQCRDIMQQKMFHHPSTSNTSGNTMVNSRHGTAENPNKVLLFEDQPLESSFIYQKFRGLSFRMKELATVLLRGSLSDFHDHNNNSTSEQGSPRSFDHHPTRSGGGHDRYINSNSTYKFHDTTVVAEVKKAYIMIRIELLVPFIKEAWTTSYVATQLNQSASNTSNHVTLSSGLRHAFSTLLRVTQLEYQLFDSLFNIDHHSTSSSEEEPRAPLLSRSVSKSNNSTSSSSDQLSQDMLRIVENISNCTRDILRPYIIRESSVDELCRVISALTEDMRSQITILSIPSLLSKQLLLGLEGAINDAKERLTYCAETKLRRDVEMFEPLPSQLSYPDILEQYEEAKKKSTSGKSSTSMDQKEQVVEVYQTWYPPMKQTLSLLSKLYGVIDMIIFEDFARRCIDLCIKSLVHASDGVRRTRQAIHGDLFLVRHLLILREQLIPFEIKMHSVERQLDFTTTTQAWSKMIHTARSTAANSNVNSVVGNSGSVSFGGVNSLSYLTTLMRFDQNNLLLQFARQGVPTMQELHIDAKKDLDFSLKKACVAFKQSALKMVLGPVDSLLAKVSAFVGDIPIDNSLNSPSHDGDDQPKVQLLAAPGSDQIAVLSTETKNILKSQAFLRPERIKECLEQVQQLLLQRLPDIKEMLKLYIESSAARTVLAKSILQEFDVSKKKLECIVGNCVDPGQTLRELEHLLHTMNYSITSELSSGY